MEEALVSAVITTYKRRPEIVVRAINSVLNQTYSHIELIVVDDSPANYSLRPQVRAMIDSLNDTRIRYIPHEQNMGACAARNTGLANANGAWIAYLDDDDEWLPTKLERQMNKQEQCSPDTAIIYCGTFAVNENKGTTATGSKRYLRGHVFNKLIEGNFIGTTSIPLIQTSALREIGGFDPLMLSAQDYDVWLRIAKKYPIDYVAEPLVRYYIHSGERITDNPKAKIAGSERIFAKNETSIQKNPVALWVHLRRIAPYHAWNGDFSKAFQYWWRAVCLFPAKIKDNWHTLYLIACHIKRYYRERI